METTINLIELDSDEFIQETGGGGSCYGDSGGPAYLVRDGLPLTLAGATSRGDNCDIGNGTYTNVVSYKDWMKKNFENMSLPIDFESPDADVSDSKFDFKIAYDFDQLSIQSSALYVSHLGNASEIGYCLASSGASSEKCDKNSVTYRKFSSSSLNGSQNRVILQSKNVGDLRKQNIKIVALDNAGTTLAYRIVAFEQS